MGFEYLKYLRVQNEMLIDQKILLPERLILLHFLYTDIEIQLKVDKR